MPGYYFEESWSVARICEDFNCLPSQAVAEMNHPTWGPILQRVMELLLYRNTWNQWTKRKPGDDLPDKAAFLEEVRDNDLAVLQMIAERKMSKRG